ncbi:MAG: hypothetical protein AAF531_18995 [Actinomycetota bacterium]
MTQEKGIPYQRHKPSAALREFLDPLDPGAYFDCGRARLRGLDDALLAEARSRGRAIGDDSFQMVATDMGLIYCRPSISFAIAARWHEVIIRRPFGDGPVVLVIVWPTHGELKFTVGKRLAGNVYRRWHQLRAPDDIPVDADLAESATDGTSPVPDQAERPVQGRERVAATVAEAAAVVVNRQMAAPRATPSRSAPTRSTPARAKTQARPVRTRANPDVDGDSPETWEVVAKVVPPIRNRRVVTDKAGKHDRRQTPDVLRRKRQEKAGDSHRRRRPPRVDAGGDSRSRWFGDLDPTTGSNVPPYDIPPLQSPDPSRPMRPGVRVSPPPEVRSDKEPVSARVSEGRRALPDESEVRSDKEPVSEPVSEVELGPPPPSRPTAEPSDVRRPDRELPTRPRRSPAVDVGVFGIDVTELRPVRMTRVADGQPVPAAAQPKADPGPVPERRPRTIAAVTGENRAASMAGPDLQVLSRPPTQEPSWIGSPGSLLTAMVVISSLVLIMAVAVGTYRQGEVITGPDPAGPSVPIVDHQRFRPVDENHLAASELGVPVVSRYSETTAPSGMIGSGTAPIAENPEWPPADGPQTCNSNYSGCVPDVGDVDCPNDGDGPIYWSESARVMGQDVYELDTDGDGEICEPDQPPLDQTGAATSGALTPGGDG